MRSLRQDKLTFGLMWINVLCMAACLFCTAASAEDGAAKLAGSVGTVFNSKYIWRGQNLVDGPVLQPQGCLAYAGWTGTVWANYDLDEGDEWTEVDYTLDYTESLGVLASSLEILSASVGYTYYTFPNLDADDDSHEVYAGLSLDTLLSPSLIAYCDFGQGDGTYYEAGVSHSLSLGAPVLSLGSSVGYNDGQWGYGSSFSAALLSVGLDVPVTKGLIWNASASSSVALDSQYDNEVFFGTSITFSF